MQGRSLSKQNRPHLVNIYQEGGGALQHHNVIPTSVSARKYIRGPPGAGAADQNAQGSTSQSTQKLTAPIKSLQQKHKHLEMQLAKLSAEVANQANGSVSHQELDQLRRRQVKQSSAQMGTGSYASPVERHGVASVPSKLRITSKDRSMSGNKRMKPQSQQNQFNKVASPQRAELAMQSRQNSQGYHGQGSASKNDRQRQISEIIDNLKKNSQGPQVTVKLAGKNTIIKGGASNASNSTPNTIQSLKNGGVQRTGQSSNSATRHQYYAGSVTHPGANNASIDLSSQQHSASLNNASSSRGMYHQHQQQQQQHYGGQTAMTASAFHPIQEDDLNQQQLINLQGNTAALVGHNALEDSSSAAGMEPFHEPQMTRGASAISGSHLGRGASGQRGTASHHDGAQTLDNFQRSHYLSPDRQEQSAQHLYQRQGSSFTKSEWQLGNSSSNAARNVCTSGDIPPPMNLQPCEGLFNQRASDLKQTTGLRSMVIVRGLENGILSLHNHLKTLEGKYIDLANYYKQELIQANQSGEDNSSQQTGPNVSMRPASSQTNQRKLQSSAKRAGSRESNQNNYVRKAMDQSQSQFSLTGQHATNQSKRTPRVEARSSSKASASGLRNFEDYKDGMNRLGSRSFKLDQAQERSIIEEVKTQKQKLENEMRNLINLYSQICGEADSGNLSQQSLNLFKSRNSATGGADFKGSQNATVLSQILFKYQNQLLTQSEYQESFESTIERTFEELSQELGDFFQSCLLETRQSSKPALSSRLPSLPLMERLEKLSGDYDIQQEYSLSNLKETMFQIQHANDQFQLDIKKIGLDFNQIQKRLLDQERGLLVSLAQMQGSAAELQNLGNLEDLSHSLDQVSNGLGNFSKRVSLNEQKLRVLQEGHGESVRYLREYRENFRRIAGEFQQTNVNSTNEVSGDHTTCADRSYGNGMPGNSKYQQEITNLNQEVFHLRTQLADAKQHGLLDLNELRDKLDMLNSENASLHGRVTEMNHEIQTKQSQLTQRDHQNQELVKKLQSQRQSVDVQTARIFEDFWRQNCQSMVDLSQKFLHSMRRLQKVVHRKETNVQQEKSDFEAAKKELEVNLKEVKRSLENQPQLQQLENNETANLASMANLTPMDASQATHATSARPFMAQSAPARVVQDGAGSTAQHAQSMRAYMPGMPSRPVMTLAPEAVNSSAHAPSEQSQVPHKMSDPDMKAKLEQTQKELADIKNENVNNSKKLQKERQKVQNLLNELKLSQENLQKIKLTFVPQENVSELESSIRQLQETISGHESQDVEHRKTIEELKLTVYELKRISEVSQLKNQTKSKSLSLETLLGLQINVDKTNLNAQQSDYSALTATVTSQISEVIMGQATWLQSIDQHLNNKQQQMAQMAETVDHVSRIVQDKNQRIRALLSQNQAMSSLIEDNQEQLGKERMQANEVNDQLQSEVSKLRGDLKIKQNGNRMLGALMRAFKQKLEEEMGHNHQVISEQTAEIEQFVQVVNQKESQVRSLSAKVEKKKFKTTQQKQALAQTQHELGQLHAKVGSQDESLARSQQDLARSQQILEQQARDLEERSKVVQEREVQVKTLQAKVDKKKFKSTQQKQVIAQTQQELGQLQSKVGSSQQELQSRGQSLNQVQAENEELKSTLKVKRSGNLMLNALMRGFKQKLEEEITNNRQALREKSEEVKQFSSVVQQQNRQIEELQVKVDQSQWQHTEVQKHAQSTEQTMIDLQTKVTQTQKQIAIREQANDKLQSEVGKLRGDLKIKQNGNRMLGALMRAFKQKLEEEMGHNHQVISEQTAEIEQFVQVVNQKESQVRSLSAKVEKKKFKTTQQKQALAQTQHELGQLHAKVGSQDESLARSQQDLARSQQILEQQARDLEERSKVVQEREVQVKTLQAKVDKKKFKSTQQKQVIAQTQQELGQLQSKVGSSQQELQSRGQSLNQVQAENEELKSILKVKRSGNLMLNALMRGFKQKLCDEKVLLEQQKLEDNLRIQQLTNELEAVKTDARIESEELLKEIESLETQLADERDKFYALKDDSDAQDELLSKTRQDLEDKVGLASELGERVRTLESQQEATKKASEATMEALRQERDQAQAQLSDFVNQHQFEKESLEGKLQHQLNQTMTILNQREDECEELQKHVTLLKEANQKVSLDIQEQALKLDKKKLKIAQFKGAKEELAQESQQDKAALEESRSLVVAFKAKLQASDEAMAAKNDEIQNLRDKLDLTIREASLKETTAVEMEEEINMLKYELDNKADLLTTAEEQKNLALGEIDGLTAQNAQFKEQIAQLKHEFSAKSEQLESAMQTEQAKLAEKDALITEAETLIQEFNHEKHDVKAKFKHLMQLLSLKASGDDNTEGSSSQPYQNEKSARASQPSSYKGRDGEVDLNHCFEELEQIVLEFKEKQESRIVELISDKEQLAGTVHEQGQDLGAMQVSLAALQTKLDDANSQVENNDGEARRQIDTAMRKITNYKTKMIDKKQSIAAMEAQIQALTLQLAEAQAKQSQSDSGIQDSFLTLQKENMQLLDRLQKTESQLQRARIGDAEPAQEETKAQQVTLSAEVVMKLDGIDERMMELKRDLYSAKSTCLKDLTGKFAEQLSLAQKTFVDHELFAKAVAGDKVTGWNNIVKECRNITFNEKQFMLVQHVSDSQYYLVEVGRLTETALKYLRAFVEDYDDDEFIQDVIGQSVHDLDEESEVEKLKALVTDLRQDRIELQAELEQFREGVKSDTSRIAHLKDEEMKDDIEYLTGENKELQLKCKEVCLTKAALQLQLAEARKQIEMHEERNEMSAIVDEATQEVNQVDASDIETARNIGLDDDLFQPVHEMPNESSRIPKDYLSDHDSVIDVVNQMEDDGAFDGSTNDVQLLREKLMQMENLNNDLQRQLDQVNRQLEQINEQKEQQDEDSGASLIPHIKVTLIQFLRNVALTDRQNEDLLTIIFNMMEFTEVEIQELKIARINIKMVKGKPAPRAQSSSLAGGNSTNSMSKDDDGSARPKRGIFGMFGKKKTDPNMSGGAQSSGGPPNLRPVPRR